MKITVLLFIFSAITSGSYGVNMKPGSTDSRLGLLFGAGYYTPELSLSPASVKGHGYLLGCDYRLKNNLHVRVQGHIGYSRQETFLRHFKGVKYVLKDVDYSVLIGRNLFGSKMIEGYTGFSYSKMEYLEAFSDNEDWNCFVLRGYPHIQRYASVGMPVYVNIKLFEHRRISLDVICGSYIDDIIFMGHFSFYPYPGRLFITPTLRVDLHGKYRG